MALRRRHFVWSHVLMVRSILGKQRTHYGTSWTCILPLKLSTKALCMGLPGAMQCHSTRVRCHQDNRRDVGSVHID